MCLVGLCFEVGVGVQLASWCGSGIHEEVKEDPPWVPMSEAASETSSFNGRQKLEEELVVGQNVCKDCFFFSQFLY